MGDREEDEDKAEDEKVDNEELCEDGKDEGSTMKGMVGLCVVDHLQWAARRRRWRWRAVTRIMAQKTV